MEGIESGVRVAHLDPVSGRTHKAPDLIALDDAGGRPETDPLLVRRCVPSDQLIAKDTDFGGLVGVDTGSLDGQTGIDLADRVSLDERLAALDRDGSSSGPTNRVAIDVDPALSPQVNPS